MKIAAVVILTWRNLFASGFDEDPQSPFMRRVRFTNIFAITAVIALCAFAVMNFFEANWLAAQIELALGLFGIFIVAYLRRTRNLKRAQTMVLVDALILMSFLFFSGGIAKTGIFWWYAFPSAAFFLKGRKRGWLWLAIVGIEVAVMILLQKAGIVPVIYSVIVLRQFAGCFIVVSLILNYYEFIRSDYEAVIEVKTRELTAEIEERKRIEADKIKLINELQDALLNVKTLKGLVPICSSCKKIRNDKGYWERVEVYVAKHTGADFSHGLCNECAHKLYPEYFDDKKNEQP